MNPFLLTLLHMQQQVTRWQIIDLEMLNEKMCPIEQSMEWEFMQWPIRNDGQIARLLGQHLYQGQKPSDHRHQQVTNCIDDIFLANHRVLVVPVTLQHYSLVW